MILNYLLDTNIVSNLRKQKPHPALLSWLRETQVANIFMSAPTIAEIQCGIGQTSNAVKAAEVQAWLDGLLRHGFPSIVPFDAKAAVVLGRLWTTASLNNFVRNDPRSKNSKSGADLAVAACAIAHRMVVVTNDGGDFLQIHAACALPGLFSPFENRWLAETV